MNQSMSQSISQSVNHSIDHSIDQVGRPNVPRRRGNTCCVGEVFVQGDEGPVGGVAQGVHCHGVTVGHEEMEEEEIEQEVEGEKEEKRSNNNAHVHGWDDYGRQVRTT